MTETKTVCDRCGKEIKEQMEKLEHLQEGTC